MATVIIRPTSDSSITGAWTTSSSTSTDYYSFIDESTASLLDYIVNVNSGGGGVLLFNFGTTGLSAGNTINSIKIYSYVNDKDYCAGRVKISSTEYTSSYTSASGNQLLSFTFTTNPATSSAWAVSELDSLVAGTIHGEISKHTPKIYQEYVEVDYTPSATGTNMQINIGDTWKDVDSLQINIGDAWKPVTKAQVNVGDTWKTIF